jgi:hypothetical protein
MRSSLRIAFIVSVLVALLLPTVAYAAGPFYTSTTGDPDGDGSATDPRQATNATELTEACEYFGGQVAAGETATLYWVLIAGSSISYFEYTLGEDGVCTPEGSLISGTPPGFGVTLTPPIIVGGLIALGILLLGAALLLRRQLRIGTCPN